MSSFSIIIPTHNAGPHFKLLLERLRSQKGELKEIVVIDSSSSDSTEAVSQEFNATFMTIPKFSFDHGGTRNSAAKVATGDILLFITQDIMPADNDLLVSFNQVFSDRIVGGAYARQIPRVGANPVEALTRQFSYPEKGRINSYDDLLKSGVTALYFANPCACIRRTVFMEVGGFPDRVICNEDMVIAHKMLKAGYKTAYVPLAVVRHSHDYSAVRLFRRYFDIGVFFASYRELRSNAKNSSEGLNQTIKSLHALSNRRYWRWIPKLIKETVVKMVGYKIGQQFRWLPVRIRKMLSMNKNFWGKR